MISLCLSRSSLVRLSSSLCQKTMAPPRPLEQTASPSQLCIPSTPDERRPQKTPPGDFCWNDDTTASSLRRKQVTTLAIVGAAETAPPQRRGLDDIFPSPAASDTSVPPPRRVSRAGSDGSTPLTIAVLEETRSASTRRVDAALSRCESRRRKLGAFCSSYAVDTCGSFPRRIRCSRSLSSTSPSSAVGGGILCFMLHDSCS